MTRGARAAACLLCAACASRGGDASFAVALEPCPPGFALDAERANRLREGLAAEPLTTARAWPGPICFGEADALGVSAGSAALLRTDAPDAALAARLAHLAVHAADGLGDGCARGVEVARASERRARSLEGAIRARAGLPALPDGALADRDYAARCAPGEPSLSAGGRASPRARGGGRPRPVGSRELASPRSAP